MLCPPKRHLSLWSNSRRVSRKNSGRHWECAECRKKVGDVMVASRSLWSSSYTGKTSTLELLQGPAFGPFRKNSRGWLVFPGENGSQRAQMATAQLPWGKMCRNVLRSTGKEASHIPATHSHYHTLTSDFCRLLQQLNKPRTITITFPE